MNHQPIFSYNITENSLTSLAHNSVFIDPNNFKFCNKTYYIILSVISEFRVNSLQHPLVDSVT